MESLKSKPLILGLETLALLSTPILGHLQANLGWTGRAAAGTINSLCPAHHNDALGFFVLPRLLAYLPKPAMGGESLGQVLDV
ncbi:MAG: hypothetical protein KJ852_14025 [Gammaproteobacteria bacterium]|nr:hypothetical protein [Gammaproteobacteria bacterium]MBU0788454.1 hypothetical protein [Gammaproteobacteria bacterium]MBU0816433.1 hypothetical protein [Gammaproteobacteria bacterium]MBU1788070.1 hypothetical protein [Gammaproteobacteria bacterium]